MLNNNLIDRPLSAQELALAYVMYSGNPSNNTKTIQEFRREYLTAVDGIYKLQRDDIS